ncbi:MAG TPA: PAS domain-containing protein [Candidatus Saccharimonadales bacterium]|nr:PAS domain-containing protein [Candidatus Saccharimonadales bacterium]
MAEGEINAPSGVRTAALSSIMYQYDLSSGELNWSSALYTLLHFPTTEPLSKLEWWISHIHPDDAMILNQAMDRLDDPKIPSWSVQYRFRSGDGSYVMMRDSATILRDASGKPMWLIGTLTPTSSVR